VSLRASTARGYAAHIRGYIVPYLGSISLTALTAGDVQAMFTAIVRDESVLFHLTALRGLRRGEAAGLRWSDLDLDAGTLTVTGQLQQLGGRMVAGPPKSDAGRRMVTLDKTTITALREHRLRQQAERAAVGTRWAGTGYVFTTQAGKPVGPDRMTRLFRKLVAASGLPPVTLHGLRHGAATLALAAGTDLKIVQDQLGHSTITLTADAYTSVLPEPPAPPPTTPQRSCSRQVPGVRARSGIRRVGAGRNPCRPGRGTATGRTAGVAPPDSRRPLTYGQGLVRWSGSPRRHLSARGRRY
jgi:integrase